MIASVANLASILATHGRRTALHFEDDGISYEEVDRRGRRVAGVLRTRGVEPGDRVALVLPNAPSFVVAYFGALRAGAIVVPLNVLLRGPEVEIRLASAAPRLLLCDETCGRDVRDAAERVGVEVVADIGTREPTDEIIERGDADPAVILFTSGTSGTPKGAVLTHGGIRAAAANAADALALHRDDVMLGAAPFSHVLGQSTGIVSTFLAGASIAVVPRFDAESTLRTMTATRTTILLGVPTMCIALCDAAHTASALPPVRIAHVGGAAVPVEVARTFERTFGGEVYEGYGLTELSGIATTWRAGQERKPGSVGMPLGDTELRVVSLDNEPVARGEPGEVEFRGSSVIPGYWNDARATAEAITADGWLRTGDMGYVDDDGCLFLVDRKKDLVLRGGYSVYPREVEEVMYAHPDVLEAAVIGVPHDTLGEEVAAVVVPRAGATPDADELRAYVRERVAAYKYPRRIAFVDELPKGPTGKILKRAIDKDALFQRRS